MTCSHTPIKGMRITLASSLVLGSLVASASAQITYVDAVEGSSGNTYATGSTPGDTTWVGTTSPNTQWDKRLTVEGNDSTLFQGAITADTLPELTTEITGLSNGTYRMWAFYWDQVDSDSQNWILSAGLNSGALTTYSSPGEPAVVGATTNGVVNANTLTFTSSVDVKAGWSTTSLIYLRNLFGIDLGLVKVTNGTARVYVDNNLTGDDSNRAWYDGVGYEMLPPITYVDATEGAAGNTFATGSALTDTTWVGPDSSSGNNTQWNKREGVEGNNSTLFQGAATVDTLPELTTQIIGLADGTYQVWAFFWDQVDNDSQNWVLSAGLTSGALTTYSAPGEPAIAGATADHVYNAENLTFTSAVDVKAGWSTTLLIHLRNLFAVDLGTVTVSGGNPVNVYIDNPLLNGTGNRAWYDGIGYATLSLAPPPSKATMVFTK